MKRKQRRTVAVPFSTFNLLEKTQIGPRHGRPDDIEKPNAEAVMFGSSKNAPSKRARDVHED